MLSINPSLSHLLVVSSFVIIIFSPATLAHCSSEIINHHSTLLEFIFLFVGFILHHCYSLIHRIVATVLISTVWSGYFNFLDMKALHLGSHVHLLLLLKSVFGLSSFNFLYRFSSILHTYQSSVPPEKDQADVCIHQFIFIFISNSTYYLSLIVHVQRWSSLIESIIL